MTREEFLKNKIKGNGYNIKEFAKLINMPYTTLLFVLNDVGRTSVDNIITICKALNITIDEMQTSSDSAIFLSAKEKEIISKYRNQPKMQSAVDKLLGVADSEK